MIFGHNKEKQKTIKQRVWSYILWSIPIFLALILFIISKQTYKISGDVEFGFTFSNMYAEELGLDWQETYTAVLDDLGVRLFRIPVYWNRVEKDLGKYDWSEIDWQLEEAKKYDTEIILAVGRRLPRWPECHDPIWLSEVDDFEAELFKYITATIERYKNNSSIIAWQVENEPFLTFFGHCPELDVALLEREINLVRSLDNRPIMITESGELSWWQSGGQVADIVGVSIYENTWNDFLGSSNYPLPPAFYYYKSRLVKNRYPGTIFLVSELQTEAWTPVPMTSFPIDKQMQSIDLDKIKKNVQFAENIGMDKILLWGVEWWYWLKEVHNMPDIWDYGKILFRK